MAYLYLYNYCCCLLMIGAWSGAVRLNLMRKSSVVRSLMPSRTFMEFGILHFTVINNNNNDVSYIRTLMTTAIKNTVSVFSLLIFCFLSLFIRIGVLCPSNFCLHGQSLKLAVHLSWSWRLGMSENLDSVRLLAELCQNAYVEWADYIIVNNIEAL